MGFNTTVMYGGYVIYPLLGGILAGLAWNYAFLHLPSQNSIVAETAPFEHRAAFMDAQNTMIPLGMTIGPLIMGLALSFTGLNGTFLIAALIALVIPTMAVIIGKRKLSAG
jgi:MFS family permease